MKLRYEDTVHTPTVMILEWQLHRKGAQLIIKGPSFQPSGFSIGVYSTSSLQQVVNQFTGQEPHPKHDWASTPRVYDALYTFTRPKRYAPRQGPQTRLAIHAERWEDYGPWITIFPPRTVTIHEQSERCFWRWLGRYSFAAICEFLREGILTAQVGTA